MADPGNELDPLRLPLHGRRLIEASAGTGKTYAIGSLFLRALLGHGRPPLGIDELLVVTFTRAATLELRDRLRKRLVEALAAFELGAHYAAEAERPDPFLAALVAECTPLATSVALLKAALAKLDEAAVFTIHGFCQRILVERAFDSGAVFEQEFVLDDRAYREQAARDFWRRQVYPLTADASALVREVWATPDALLASVRAHLGRPDLELRGAGDTSFPAALASARQALQALQRCWRDGGVRARIEGSSVPKAKTGGGGAANLDAVDAWCASDEWVFAAPGPDGRLRSIAALLGLYRREVLLAKPLKKGEPPELDDFFEVLEAALDALDTALARLRADALRAIRADMDSAKRTDARISPDDVLRETERGLRGPAGEAFARAVRRAYPVAFIDEFQDTDPVQYRIFDALYPDPEDAATALVMIGDPKQAIYAFRGADVYAYLDAAAALAPEARLAMATNWRSTPEMLAAIEALYEDADSPFAVDGIEFVEVGPRPGAPTGRYRDAEGPLPALTFWHLEAGDSEVVRTGVLRTALTRQLVQEVAALLSRPVEAGGDVLHAGRIAVLVRNHFEAELVHAALSRAGIASVRQSRRTVFATEEAGDLQALLAAALEPRDEARVRTALATSLLAQPLDRLHRELHEDEAAWQQHLDRFARYHELWRRQGPMVMLGALLADYAIPHGLLRSPEGPRRLTDLRHLGELLQRQTATLGSMHRLLRWFAQQRAEAEDAEASRMRLETDADLVRIVTMHASKGLEYEVVMLPFGVWMREAEDAAFHAAGPEGWRAVLDLRPDASAMARADEERLAEDLRLLYVALTRAKSACYVGVANLAPQRGPSRLRRTALGRLLLGPGDAASEAELASRLVALAEACPQIAVAPVSREAIAAGLLEPAALPVARRTPFAGRVRDDWRLTSYSALVDPGESAVPWAPGAGDEDHALEGPGITSGDDVEEQSIAHRFPKGPRPGSCLHAMLEEWPEAATDELAHVARTLTAWGLDGEPDSDPRAVLEWLRCVRRTPLPAGVDLAGATRVVHEMEFHLPLEGADTGRLRELLGAHGYGDGPLALDRVRGMMRGFVDLVLEHEGRFWIVDYKSNWLGPNGSAYGADALLASVREHRYDLQYLIYCVALRRLLRARLGSSGAECFG
ncbi:MAG: UvrD-helicase domain-containing protein, partial [Pseudomonadales bacterium]|nr:UvrD-helicase domain-containing protein [Pseudomonadales bacterium]